MRDTYVFLGLILLFAAVNIGLVASGILAADWTGLGIIVAAGLTLALYSFLYKDNPLFKFAEHVFRRRSGGLCIRPDLVPDALRRAHRRMDRPGGRGDAQLVAFGSDGARAVDVDALFAALWLAQPLCVCIFVGLGAGPDDSPLYFFLYLGPDRTYITTTNLELGGAQFASSPRGGHRGVGLFLFFCRAHWRGGPRLQGGDMVLMVSFGASFGYTIMARVSLLIGRVTFLLDDWLHLM